MKYLLFRILVGLAIFINKWNRKSLVKEYFSATAFAMEACTVHINVGRRTGKSTYINKVVKPKDLIIVHDFVTKDMLLDLRKSIGNADEFYQVITAHTLKGMDRKYFIETQFPDTIYIDEPELVSRVIPVAEIYDRLTTRDRDQTFVLLG